MFSGLVTSSRHADGRTLLARDLGGHGHIITYVFLPSRMGSMVRNEKKPQEVRTQQHGHSNGRHVTSHERPSLWCPAYIPRRRFCIFSARTRKNDRQPDSMTSRESHVYVECPDKMFPDKKAPSANADKMVPGKFCGLVCLIFRG